MVKLKSVQERRCRPKSNPGAPLADEMLFRHTASTFDAYCAETRGIAARLYRADIKAFGYEY